jgi:hypothetical protein
MTGTDASASSTSALSSTAPMATLLPSLPQATLPLSFLMSTLPGVPLPVGSVALTDALFAFATTSSFAPVLGTSAAQPTPT